MTTINNQLDCTVQVVSEMGKQLKAVKQYVTPANQVVEVSQQVTVPAMLLSER